MPGKIGLIFSISGDLRFLSHQDMLRLFSRAVSRSELSLAYSQGYNPRPKLWLVLPRPLGVACCEDLLVVEPADDCAAEQFAVRMAEHLPVGIDIVRSVSLGDGALPQPICAWYSLELSRQESAQVSEKIPALLDSGELLVERSIKRSGRTREVNLRPYLEQLHLAGAELTFALSYGPGGSAKPAEILALLGLDHPANKAAIVRKNAEYVSLERSNHCPEKC